MEEGKPGRTEVLDSVSGVDIGVEEAAAAEAVV